MELKRVGIVLGVLCSLFVAIVAAILSLQIPRSSFVNEEVNTVSSPTNDYSLIIEESGELLVSSSPVALVPQSYYAFSFPKLTTPSTLNLINVSLKLTSFVFQTVSLNWEIFVLPGNINFSPENLISTQVASGPAKVTVDRAVQYYPAGLDIYIDLTTIEPALWQDSTTVVVRPVASNSQALVVHGGGTGEVAAPRLVLAFASGTSSSSTSIVTTSSQITTQASSTAVSTTTAESVATSSQTTTISTNSTITSNTVSPRVTRSAGGGFGVTTTARSTSTLPARSSCLGDYNNKADSRGVFVDSEDLVLFGDLYSRTLTGNEVYLYDLTAGDSVSNRLTLLDLAIFASNYNRLSCVISRN